MMYLAFYHGRSNYIGWLIRLISRGPYSHVELIFSDGSTLGSSGRGFKPGVFFRFKKIHCPCCWDLIAVDINRESEKTLRHICIAEIGKRFDWRGLWSYVLPGLHSLPGHWYCSSLLISLFHRIGMFEDIPTNTNPNALYRILNQ